MQTPALADGAGIVSVGRIHVWQLDLAPDGRDWRLLDDQEHARALRRPARPSRERFVAAHAALRRTLARYTDTQADQIRFVYGPRGKPGVDGCEQLRFSLSHTRNVALVAVAHGVPLGIDVERIRDDRPCATIAARYFPPSVAHALATLPHAEQPRAFHHAWSVYEAYLKAAGTGLGSPSASRQEQALDYRFALFEPAPELVAALCWRGAPRAIHFARADAARSRDCGRSVSASSHRRHVEVHVGGLAVAMAAAAAPRERVALSSSW